MRPAAAALRAVAGALFTASGFLKLIQPHQNFQSVIETYGVISGQPAAWAARAFPWAEFLLGIFLALGLWTRSAARGLWLLVSVFLVALVSALWRRLPIGDCGCFGEAVRVNPRAMALIDVLLWLLLAWMVLRPKDFEGWGLDRLFRPVEWR